jgi:hypothetical protein
LLSFHYSDTARPFALVRVFNAKKWDKNTKMQWLVAQ